MKLSLNVSLRQTLAPQLIQSLKLLQMPILRLEQTIRQELAINPMLEESETTDEATDQETDELAEQTSVRRGIEVPDLLVIHAAPPPPH